MWRRATAAWTRGRANFLQVLRENPTLSAGLWVSAAGVASGAVYIISGTVADFVSRYYFVTLTVRNKEAAFGWVVDWVAESQGSNFITSNRLLLKAPGGGGEDEVEFVPGIGPHAFIFRGHVIFMTRDARETITSGFDRQPYVPEELRLWARDRRVLKEFIDECREHARQKRARSTCVYTVEHGEWGLASRRPRRPLESVVLPEHCDVVGDAKEFLSAKDWYTQNGVPYRRGYLFHGPPGNGKSSAVAALAAQLHLHISTLSLNTRGLDDVALAHLLRSAPPDSILLLEDIDTLFHQPHDDVYLTFSGLLNALDGVASQEGRLLIMTTNHLDRLDPALLRPGRCDVAVEFGNATQQQVERMVSRFMDVDPVSLRDFAREVGDGTVSMASLQGHLLRCRGGGTLPTAAEVRSSAMAPSSRGELSIAVLARMVGAPSAVAWWGHEAGARKGCDLDHADLSVPPPPAVESMKRYVRNQLHPAKEPEVGRVLAARFDGEEWGDIPPHVSGMVTVDAWEAFVDRMPDLPTLRTFLPLFLEDRHPVPPGLVPRNRAIAEGLPGTVTWTSCIPIAPPEVCRDALADRVLLHDLPSYLTSRGVSVPV